jgi:hypothetical protein
MVNTKKDLKKLFINLLKNKTMRKKILSGSALLAIAAVAAWNVNINSHNDLSGVSLANVEALAQEGNSSPCSMCEVVWGSICWFSSTDGCIGYKRTFIYC